MLGEVIITANAGIQALSCLKKLDEDFKRKYETREYLVQFDYIKIDGNKGTIAVTAYNTTDNNVGEFYVKHNGERISKIAMLPSKWTNTVNIIEVDRYFSDFNAYRSRNMNDKVELDDNRICKLTLCFDDEMYEVNVDLDDIVTRG